MSWNWLQRQWKQNNVTTPENDFCLPISFFQIETQRVMTVRQRSNENTRLNWTQNSPKYTSSHSSHWDIALCRSKRPDSMAFELLCHSANGRWPIDFQYLSAANAKEFFHVTLFFLKRTSFFTLLPYDTRFIIFLFFLSFKTDSTLVGSMKNVWVSLALPSPFNSLTI